MSLLTPVVAAATAVTGLAVAQSGGSVTMTLGDAAAQCGNHQQISCCSKGNSPGTLLDGLPGGNCSPIHMSNFAVDVPISTACTAAIACCIGDEKGLMNLACTTLNT